MPRGRTTTYTAKAAAEICEQLSEGRPLYKICEAPHLPAEGTVRGWALRDEQGFATKYARARELGYERWAEEILSIADDGSHDFMERQARKGEGTDIVLDREHVERSKIRMEARKWLLSKLLPKKYGDRLKIETANKPDDPATLTDEDLALIARAGRNGTTAETAEPPKSGRLH